MRILVVEDKHKIANSIRQGFEQESFAVDVAYTGTDGYDLASTEEYDAILLDLLLPGVDGVTICKKLRAQNIHTPILMLTAKSQINDKVEGLDSGADDYLTKPFAFEELLARVRALGRRPKHTVGTMLTVENLSLDTSSFELSRDGKHITLSHREFSLLEYFMRHPGKTLTKDHIINHVWNYDADILPNTVEVYIGYLRNKLGKPEILHTVRGFGYKLGYVSKNKN